MILQVASGIPSEVLRPFLVLFDFAMEIPVDDDLLGGVEVVL